MKESKLAGNKFFFLIILLLITGCQDRSYPEDTGNRSTQDVIDVSFADFRANPQNYAGKYIKIVGLAIRPENGNESTIYLIDKDPNVELKIKASDDVIKFSRYFEGRIVEMQGIVRNDSIWERYLLTTKKNDAKGVNSISSYYLECNEYRRLKNK